MAACSRSQVIRLGVHTTDACRYFADTIMINTATSWDHKVNQIQRQYLDTTAAKCESPLNIAWQNGVCFQALICEESQTLPVP